MKMMEFQHFRTFGARGVEKSIRNPGLQLWLRGGGAKVQNMLKFQENAELSIF